MRKQLEEALRHYARLQQELVLEQGARTKKDEQVTWHPQRKRTRNPAGEEIERTLGNGKSAP